MHDSHDILHKRWYLPPLSRFVRLRTGNPEYIAGLNTCPLASIYAPNVSMETLRTHVRQSAVDSVWTFSFVQRIMSSPSQAARNVLCLGDPDAFASEMIKMINDKEFRWLEPLPPCSAPTGTHCFQHYMHTVTLGFLSAKSDKSSTRIAACWLQGSWLHDLVKPQTNRVFELSSFFYLPLTIQMRGVPSNVCCKERRRRHSASSAFRHQTVRVSRRYGVYLHQQLQPFRWHGNEPVYSWVNYMQQFCQPQAVDIVAAAIEYGLDGLTRVSFSNLIRRVARHVYLCICRYVWDSCEIPLLTIMSASSFRYSACLHGQWATAWG